MSVAVDMAAAVVAFAADAAVVGMSAVMSAVAVMRVEVTPAVVDTAGVNAWTARHCASVQDWPTA